MRHHILSILATLLLATGVQAQTASWTADNGNGTFTNPLFSTTSPAPRCTACPD